MDAGVYQFAKIVSVEMFFHLGQLARVRSAVVGDASHYIIGHFEPLFVQAAFVKVCLDDVSFFLQVFQFRDIFHDIQLRAVEITGHIADVAVVSVAGHVEDGGKQYGFAFVV